MSILISKECVKQIFLCHLALSFLHPDTTNALLIQYQYQFNVTYVASYNMTIFKNEFILRDMNLSNFSSDSIDNAVASSNEVLYDNAKKCLALKRHRVKHSTKRSKNKKWFDTDCETAKKEVLVAAKTLQRYPKDPIVQGKYHNLKKN